MAQARAAFTRGSAPLRAAAADVRALPFCDASFDAIYSMGTIEHFDETEQAVREMARVLKVGGRAIVGVPNRHDPFLRPLLATALQAVGLYAYGYEKSYSRRALREMLERAGFSVTARDRDPVHPRRPADARPRVPLVVPARCRGSPPRWWRRSSGSIGTSPSSAATVTCWPPSRSSGRLLLVPRDQVVDQTTHAAGRRADARALLAARDRADRGSATGAAADDQRFFLP